MIKDWIFCHSIKGKYITRITPDDKHFTIFLKTATKRLAIQATQLNVLTQYGSELFPFRHWELFQLW